jgi:phosphopantothenoylcysteine decarboxylase/phosphopantothenate--cysteine ligase
VLAEASGRSGIRIVRVGTAAELAGAVFAESEDREVVVMAAAVADYRVADVAPRKLSKEGRARGLRLDLVENVDILAGLVDRRRDDQTIVGFAAETAEDGELIERGRRKRARKGVDLLAVNEVGWSKGFESDDNALHIIDARGDVVAEPKGSKREVADALWDAVLSLRSGVV